MSRRPYRFVLEKDGTTSLTRSCPDLETKLEQREQDLIRLSTLIMNSDKERKRLTETLAKKEVEITNLAVVVQHWRDKANHLREESDAKCSVLAAENEDLRERLKERPISTAALKDIIRFIIKGDKASAIERLIDL